MSATIAAARLCLQHPPPQPPPPGSYKEDLGVVSATIAAAMDAALPPGVTRTLYLCDDGNVRGMGGRLLLVVEGQLFVGRARCLWTAGARLPQGATSSQQGQAAMADAASNTPHPPPPAGPHQARVAGGDLPHSGVHHRARAGQGRGGLGAARGGSWPRRRCRECARARADAACIDHSTPLIARACRRAAPPYPPPPFRSTARAPT